MPSETKKRCGENGAKKGKSTPFRLNGRHPRWAAIALGATTCRPMHHGGSRMARGLLGGVLAASAGYHFPIVSEPKTDSLNGCPTVSHALDCCRSAA